MRFTLGGTTLAIAIASLEVFSGSARPPSEIIVEQDQVAKMRDGVELNADIYRPADAGKYPVLLTRTPYHKAGQNAFGVQAAQQGYVVIAQDVRGRYSSPGEFYTFKNEGVDGYDTIEWAAALPYSDGRVAMYGGSYVGATQWLAAMLHPPHLVAIAPTVTASNYHDGW
ncbi:MAG: CocE/NonD family hydrolase, partial [Candidatus Acidiferrales bacterium]